MQSHRFLRTILHTRTSSHAFRIECRPRRRFTPCRLADRIEFAFWDALHGGARDRGGFTEITDEELDVIRELSELVEGWHIYERFIPMTEWRAIVAARG